MPTTANADVNAVLSELPGLPIFSGFDTEALKKLCAGGKVHVHQHRDILFSAGEKATHFAIVLGGAYKLSRLNFLGEDAVIHFSPPGDVIAAMVLPQPNPLYPVTAQAMGPSRALLIEKEVYLNNWIKSPELISRIQGLMSTRMARLQNQKVMQRAPLESRVAAFLLQLMIKDNKNNELGIPLPLTRKEIAEALGSTVESIIRVMSPWAKQGLITTAEQYIKIHKPEILVKLSQDFTET